MSSVETSLPDALSHLYPLLLVVVLLLISGTLTTILFIKAFLKEWRYLSLESSSSSASNQDFLRAHTRSPVFWAKVILIVEKVVKSDGELARLHSEIERLMSQNNELKNAQRGSLEKQARLAHDNEQISAKLRVAEADLAKGRAAREKLDQRCQGLDSQLKKLLLEVSRTYQNTSKRPAFAGAPSDEVVLLKGTIQARDLEIERLRSLLNRAETELRKKLAA